MSDPQIRLYGIRHHGPGSARNLAARLKEFQPDIVLVEGPPEANGLLELVGHDALVPPVALLAYQPGQPAHAVFYPFAVFSPEWQAFLYANTRQVPVRCIDLPLVHKMALQEQNQQLQMQRAAEHPLTTLAKMLGYEDEEKWWDETFETGSTDADVFEAIRLLMRELRQSTALMADETELLREASMRQEIRKAIREHFSRIAVVCGAWHVPALEDLQNKKADETKLKRLPKTKVTVTWSPWTYERLSWESGYGAGIVSPGWYEYLWTNEQFDATPWLSQAASLFRSEGMDLSPESVLASVVLSNNLAVVRQKSAAGLAEMNDAILSVMCQGDQSRMSVIWKSMITGNKIGKVPFDLMKIPLLVDLENQYKLNRISIGQDEKRLVLDLRQPRDKAKSHLMHRVHVLAIPGIGLEENTGLGTFRETWQYRWMPETTLRVIDCSTWGNTVEQASGTYLAYQAAQTQQLSSLCRLLAACIPADLPQIVKNICQAIENATVGNNDIPDLIAAFPPLVATARYTNVRKTDKAMVLSMLDTLMAKISVGLPYAVSGIEDTQARKLAQSLEQLHRAQSMLQDDSIGLEWKTCLQGVILSKYIHPYLSGFISRMLRESRWIAPSDMTNLLSAAMSATRDPSQAALWLEGFLKESGKVMLLDETLFNLVDDWMQHLENEQFTSIMPLLRKTFSAFAEPEKRKLGEKIRSRHSGNSANKNDPRPFDHDLAISVVQAFSELLQ